MDLFSKTADLAKSIKESEEYQRYQQSKSKVMTNPQMAVLLREFRQRQFEIQMNNFVGAGTSDSAEESLEEILSILAMDRQVNEYLLAEYNLVRLMQEIQSVFFEGLDIFMDNDGDPETVPEESSILYN